MDNIRLGVLASATVAAIISFALLRRSVASKEPSTLRRVIPSPRQTLLPKLSPAQANALAYPPNFFPGARDVETHYGTMRVYEWGSVDGMKVLLIHGDTTPAPMFAPIAESLAKKGCRVMIIDLWGRGYSDTPLDTRHDGRLFAMQILFATASSPLSWTGASSSGFSIIGFSLGGGITMSFAAHYPYLVNSIILLAPAGILRYVPDDYENFFFRHSSWVPSGYLRKLVGRLQGVDLANRPNALRDTDHEDTGPEVPQKKRLFGKQTLDIPAVVQWQFDYHQGFCHSFVDTIAYGPIMHQQSDWQKACNVKNGNAPIDPLNESRNKLRNSKFLVVFGDSDDVVAGGHVSEDLKNMLGGSQHVEFKTVPGGHGFPVTSSEDVIKHIGEFWGI